MTTIDRLLTLAADKSPSNRNSLMRAVADMFFATSSRRTAASNLFDDVMEMVLADVEPTARRELAERVAALDDPPRRTLLRLAGDDIVVAEPILRRSPALADADLAPIVRYKSQRHLVAIAHRVALSEQLTDLLVAHGNDNVAGVLAGNDGARFTDHGFSALARRAAANDNVLDRLMARRDLPDKIAADLLPALAAAMRARLENLDAGFDPEAACELLGAAHAMLAERLRASATPARSLTRLVALIDSGDLLFGEAVIELADADHLVDLAALIGRRLSLRSDRIVTNLFGAEREPAMLICRAAGLDPDAFSAVLRLRRRRRRDGGEPGAALRDYLAIPRDLACGVVATVRERERNR